MRSEKLEQGSQEWHDFRAKHRMASETPSVMGVSPWYPKTHIQLARVKRGLDVIPDNPAMAHGRDNEARARAWVEQHFEEALQPCVVVDDEGVYGASLDGISFDGETIVEVKAPPNGRSSHLYTEVALGNIPENYMLQIQHQLMVSEAKVCKLAIWDGLECMIKDVLPNPELWPKIRQSWDAFWPLVTQEEEPVELTQRDDDPWRQAAERFLILASLFKDTEKELAEAKLALDKMADRTPSVGAGVKVTYHTREGNVNYKVIPELKGVDLEKYRGKPSSFCKVQAVKEK